MFRRDSMTGRMHSLIYVALFMTVAAPLMGQQKISMRVIFDSSRCNYRRMLFQEKRFGGELQTLSDSILVFDASECQAAYIISGKVSIAHIKEYGRSITLTLI